MKFEVEQKFRVPSAVEIESRLASMSAKIEEPVEQVDTYYAHPCRDFWKTDEALRIRRVGGKSWITYKGPKLDKTTKTRHEIDLPLPTEDDDADAFRKLLEALGFSKVADVRKRRRKVDIHWNGKAIEGALDEVEGVGTFVELEIVTTKNDVDEAKSLLASLAEHLGLRENERRSYLELLLAERK